MIMNSVPIVCMFNGGSKGGNRVNTSSRLSYVLVDTTLLNKIASSIKQILITDSSPHWIITGYEIEYILFIVTLLKKFMFSKHFQTF